MKVLPAALLLLATLAPLSTGKKFRWCTLSDLEQRKCSELSRALVAVLPPAAVSAFARVSCISARNANDCINKIRVNKADAASLDAGDVYSAVQVHGLSVVAKEVYPEGSCVFAVAVARRGTLDIHSLKGTRSCHNGAQWTSGWNLPLGFLLASNPLMWGGNRPVHHVLSGYFNASCIPGAGAAAPQLCALCQGQKSYIQDKNHFCEASSREPFHGSEGAFRCLKSGVADVAFLDHLTIMRATESEEDDYELLCPDGSTAPLPAYATCNLGRGPGRAVVTRHSFQKVARKFLATIQHLFGKAGKERVRFELFASAPFRGKDLLFHDATRHFQTTAEEAQISRILGLEYVALLQALGHEGSSLANSLVRWCCIGDAELRKCEEWALHIRSDPLVCVHADSKTNCIELIKNNGADAVALDATHAYFADKCGLRAVAAECYADECLEEEGSERQAGHATLPPVYAIALVKKAAKHLSILNLRGRRSCHSHVYSPAGWLLPSRYTATAPGDNATTCSLSSAYQEYFWKGCMPGAGGNLCKVCIGPAEREGDKPASRCAAHHDERYYGNLGALRCLFGDPHGRSFGDVAFLEHHNLLQNVEYLKSSGWATGYSAGDLELLCPDGSRAAVTDWRTCNLGPVPPSVVVARPMTVARVYDFLAKSQEVGAAAAFRLFQSQKYEASDLLFKDATQRLVPVRHLPYEAILGQAFLQLAESIFSCTPAGILDFCKMDSCASSAQ